MSQQAENIITLQNILKEICEQDRIEHLLSKDIFMMKNDLLIEKLVRDELYGVPTQGNWKHTIKLHEKKLRNKKRLVKALQVKHQGLKDETTKPEYCIRNQHVEKPVDINKFIIDNYPVFKKGNI